MAAPDPTLESDYTPRRAKPAAGAVDTSAPDDGTPDMEALIPEPDPGFDLQPHEPHWHHPQLAPPHVERQSDGSEWQDGEGSTMAVSGHDIRMKEFRRSYLRGYSAEDVDTFLMDLAVEMDQRERYYRSLERKGAPQTTSPEPAQRSDDGLFEDEPVQPRHAAAHDAGEEIIAEAKATAERGLQRARERAQEMILEAQEQQERAARAEAEVQLRLAHLEQRVGDRAAALAAEARRLDELVAWLAENDLAPDTAEWHTPSHAAPSDGDVVQLPRSAQN